MKDLYDLTMDEDGFFEGVYDYMPNADELATTWEQLDSYIPYIGRWSLSHARPELFGFKRAIDSHLPSLSPPYRQTNTLVQVGLQFWNKHEDRSPVPDGYMVQYSRSGRGMGDTDQTKSLVVDVLRADVAAQIAAEEDVTNDMTKLHWQRAARLGTHIGNAVLVGSVDVHSYSSFTSRQTTDKNRKPFAVTDRALAEEVFNTILYWQE